MPDTLDLDHLAGLARAEEAASAAWNAAMDRGDPTQEQLDAANIARAKLHARVSGAVILALVERLRVSEQAWETLRNELTRERTVADGTPYTVRSAWQETGLVGMVARERLSAIIKRAAAPLGEGDA
jgi:hypothetical protein